MTGSKLSHPRLLQLLLNLRPSPLPLDPHHSQVKVTKGLGLPGHFNVSTVGIQITVNATVLTQLARSPIGLKDLQDPLRKYAMLLLPFLIPHLRLSRILVVPLCQLTTLNPQLQSSPGLLNSYRHLHLFHQKS